MTLIDLMEKAKTDQIVSLPSSVLLDLVRKASEMTDKLLEDQRALRLYVAVTNVISTSK